MVRRTITEDIILRHCTPVPYSDSTTHEYNLLDTLDEFGVDG